MSLKKGFWVIVILLLATNTLAIGFPYSIIQKVSGEIPLDFGNPQTSTCNPEVVFRLPYVAQRIKAWAWNQHCGAGNCKWVLGVSSSDCGQRVSSGVQICTGTACGPMQYTGSRKSHNCGPWDTVYTGGWLDSSGDTIKACAGNQDKSERGTWEIFVYTTKTANVTKTEKKSLGNPADLAAPYVANKGDQFTVERGNNRVYMWIENNEVFACYDSDKNEICDADQEKECAKEGADWNGLWPGKTESLCCGIAPRKPTTECEYYEDLRSICGKDEAGKWKWAPSAIEGQVTKLACPAPISFLSEKEELRVCGNTAGTTLSGTNFETFTEKIRRYEERDYMCLPNISTIYECTGNEGPLAESSDYKISGDYIEDDGTVYFCSPKQKEWITDLNKDEEACLAAKYPGVEWTGTKCCGDPADEGTPQGNYQDEWQKDYQGKAGGCYENKFIASGEYADEEQTIINYQGEFYACNPYLEEATTSTTTLPGTTMEIQEAGACGKPKINATFTGIKHNIVCEPTGQWKFIEETAMTYITQTKWETEIPEGCCTEDQCWDGTKCRETGEYYTLEEKGYRCE